MRRLFAAFTIILVTLILDSYLSLKAGDAFLIKDINSDMAGTTFVIFGILVGGLYSLKFGSSYSWSDSKMGFGGKVNTNSIYSKIPGKSYFVKLGHWIWKRLGPTAFGRYLHDIYSPPVESEQVLGGFFFGKTMITIAIAFYNVEPAILIGILGFSAVFDSLTGIYQQTLMNFFHRSYFKNRAMVFLQNLFKRYILDIFRAEIISIILLGVNCLTFAEQFHIFKNRFVSATYYFNAVLIDRLVEMGAITRSFRSKFVIIASTIGGILGLLDFARTEFPQSVPKGFILSIPEWFPGPLEMLVYFNMSVFVLAGGIYLWALWRRQSLSLENFQRALREMFVQRV